VPKFPLPTDSPSALTLSQPKKMAASSFSASSVILAAVTISSTPGVPMVKKHVRVDTRTKRLSRSEDSAVVLEVGNRPVETGTMAIRIFGHNDKTTFTCLFVLVILSISRLIKRHFTQVNGIPTYKCNGGYRHEVFIPFTGQQVDYCRRLFTAFRLPLPNSEESIVNLSLSHKNGVYHFFRRTGKLVSKYVHQGDGRINRKNITDALIENIGFRSRNSPKR